MTLPSDLCGQQGQQLTSYWLPNLVAATLRPISHLKLFHNILERLCTPTAISFNNFVNITIGYCWCCMKESKLNDSNMIGNTSGPLDLLLGNSRTSTEVWRPGLSITCTYNTVCKVMATLTVNSKQSPGYVKPFQSGKKTISSQLSNGGGQPSP